MNGNAAVMSVFMGRVGGMKDVSDVGLLDIGVMRNMGNMVLKWGMVEVRGDGKYGDIVERGV